MFFFFLLISYLIYLQRILVKFKIFILMFTNFEISTLYKKSSHHALLLQNLKFVWYKVCPGPYIIRICIKWNNRKIQVKQKKESGGITWCGVQVNRERGSVHASWYNNMEREFVFLSFSFVSSCFLSSTILRNLFLFSLSTPNLQIRFRHTNMCLVRPNFNPLSVIRNLDFIFIFK